MSTCRRCNRQLKREPWRSLGIGKICSQKEQVGAKQHEAESGDIIMPYDGEDIWIERIASPTYDRRGQLVLMNHSCSGIKTNIQRIETKHSPSGFNFGYGGSGPADTALNICLMFTDKETAHNIYQDFKWKFLGEQGDKLVIPKQKIIDFIKEEKRNLITKKFQEAEQGTLFYAHGRTTENENIYPTVTKHFAE